MIIKIGNLELQDWVYPAPWYIPYRFHKDQDIYHPAGSIDMVFIDYGPYDNRFFPRFFGALEYLRDICPPQNYTSYDDAKSKVDSFLIRIGKMSALT